MGAPPTLLDELTATVAPGDRAALAAAAERHAVLAKPPGSLGRLEEVGGRLAAISRRCPPPVPEAPVVLVAAADHGVHAQGVTPWPQELTARMVEVFCAGRGGVNAIARTVGATVAVLDVGCASRPADHPALHRARVRPGTADLTVAGAMARTDATAALAAGAALTDELIAAGADVLVTGDMGIGNTTATACLIAAFTGAAVAAVTGPGAGVTDPTLRHKMEVVGRGLARHRPNASDPVGALAAVGGLEHAALAGMMLMGASRRVPVVLDGVVTNAAALVAAAMAPDVVDHLIASHRSPEPGATVALGHLGLEPLLDLGLRLGEGTGGLLAVPLVQAAARTLGELATLDELRRPAAG